MRVQVSKTFLNAATARSQGVVSERSLAQIGLRATKQALTVAAADRVLAVYSETECEVMEEGTSFVPARLLTDVARELPQGPVRLETDSSHLTITAGPKDEFIMKLPLVEEATWQELPNLSSNNSADVQSAQFEYMMAQMQFCVSQDSPRNYGSVAYLHRPRRETLRLVGTDGFRLSYSEVETESLPEEFLAEGVCLSKRVLTELGRMCAEGTESIRLAVSEDHSVAMASLPGYQMFFRLSAVPYPSYQDVIPNVDGAEVIRVSRSHLNSVTKRVLLASDRSKALELSFSQSSLTLSSRTVGSCEGTEDVALEGYTGKGCRLIVNGRFLADVLSSVVTEAVEFRFTDADSRIVITPVDEQRSCKTVHVLVPIKEST